MLLSKSTKDTISFSAAWGGGRKGSGIEYGKKAISFFCSFTVTECLFSCISNRDSISFSLMSGDETWERALEANEGNALALAHSYKESLNDLLLTV